MPGRQKTAEQKRLGVKAADRQSRGQRGSSRNGHDPDAALQGNTNEMMARIGDAGRPGVRDVRDAQSVPQPGKHHPAAFLFVVLVQADHGRFDLIRGKQDSGTAGVFRGNQVNLPEHAQRPEGNVLQIADRRGHHIKNALCFLVHCTAFQTLFMVDIFVLRLY